MVSGVFQMHRSTGVAGASKPQHGSGFCSQQRRQHALPACIRSPWRLALVLLRKWVACVCICVLVVVALQQNIIINPTPTARCQQPAASSQTAHRVHKMMWHLPVLT